MSACFHKVCLLNRPEYRSRQPFPFPGDVSNPGIKPRSSALQAASLPAEPQGKPKNTGVGSLSLLQPIFLNKESQCRRPWFNSQVGKCPPRRDRLPAPVFLGFPGGSDGKESTSNVRDLSSIPGLGRSSGGGHGNPLQYSCLENPHGQRSLVGCSPSVESQRVRHD